MNQAPPKAGEKKRDRALYARLVESYQADRVGIFVDFDRLNHPKSPVWDPWENVGPLLDDAIGSMAGDVLRAIFSWAPPTMVLGVLFYLFVMRPWIAPTAVSTRHWIHATDNLHNWNVLWKLGGLVITLNYMSKTRCVSPDGDWRAFVTRYLPEMEMEGVEVYNAFNRPEKPRTTDDNEKSHACKELDLYVERRTCDRSAQQRRMTRTRRELSSEDLNWPCGATSRGTSRRRQAAA